MFITYTFSLYIHNFQPSDYSAGGGHEKRWEFSFAILYSKNFYRPWGPAVIDISPGESYTEKTKEVNPMKRKNIPEAAKILAMPVTVTVFGLLLLIFPDSASLLIAYGVGGCLLLAGILMGIGALLDRRLSQILWTLVCLSLGSTLIGNPLLLAWNVGRFLGILLAIEGGSCLRKGSRTFGTVLLVAAAVMVLAPMTLSRLVFSLCGAVALVMGIAMLVPRLKQLRYLPKGKDNIIDAL